jgi:hypothetical protein
MANNKKLVTRRDFLAVSGAVIAAGALSACAAKTVTNTVTETKTSPPTTVTPAAVTSTVTASPVTSTKTVTNTSTVTTTSTPAAVTTTSVSKPWIPAKWDMETDVVVAGTGYAGMAAAIAVIKNKNSLILLEKAPEKYAGGNSSVSVGGNSIWDVHEEGITDLTHAGLDCPAELVEAMYQALAAVPAQLKEIGIELTTTGTTTKKTWKIKTATSGTGGAPGSVLWDAIMKAATGMGIKPLYETPVKRLIQDASTKEILGVVATQAGKDINIKAKKAVILAIGSYENSSKYMGWYNRPGIEIFVGGTPYNTGDGIGMMSEVGAPIWHCTLMEWEATNSAKASRALGCSVELRLPAGAMFVNRAGNRFVAETTSFTHVHEEIPPCEFQRGVDVRAGLWYGMGGYPNMPFFLICDSDYMKKGAFFPTPNPGNDTKWCPVKVPYTWSSDNQTEVTKGWISKANTLDDLAKAAGIDAAGLKATVAKWNGYVTAGADPDFGVAKANLAPVLTAPFYCMELGLSLINTMGGPQHNKYAQTLDYAGKPIARLYSPGEFGSFFGLCYSGGVNIPEAHSFGRIAANHAVTLTAWDGSAATTTTTAAATTTKAATTSTTAAK